VLACSSRLPAAVACKGDTWRFAWLQTLVVCIPHCQGRCVANVPADFVLLVQVVVRELPKAWYKFLTTTCAVVGGVFTVAGILDSILHTGLSAVRKKVELGKMG